jgi:hypothetical protein
LNWLFFEEQSLVPGSLPCASYKAEAPPALAEVALGFECPAEISGMPGEVETFTAFATLSTQENTTAQGALAWSISMTAEGATIRAITTAGLVVPTRQGPMDLSEAGFKTSGLASHEDDPSRAGALSAVILTRSLIPSKDDLRSLEPEGTVRIAELTVEVTIPTGDAALPATLKFEDGFKGFGEPVVNVVSFDRESTFGSEEARLTSQVPTLGACTVMVRAVRPSARLLRGDCDGDREVRGVVTDAVFLLNFLFLGGERPSCLAACDANSDGQVTGVVTDAVYLLTYNFLGGPPPAPPYPECEAFAGCENRCG